MTKTLHHRPGRLLAALLLPAPSAVHAAVLNVPGDFSTVAAAVTAADIGDVIRIGAGKFPANLVFGKSLTLEGAGMSKTTLDGHSAGPVLTTTPGVTLTVRDLSVQSGSAPQSYGFGGGVLNDGDLRMERCSIVFSHAPVAGGGLSNVNGTARLTDCQIVLSSAGFGGAIDNNATLTLENCTLSGNNADTAGAIINSGQLTMNNTTITNNGAGDASAVFFHSGTADLQYSTVNRNWAVSEGHGVVLALTSFTARGVIIAGNGGSTGTEIVGEMDSHGYNIIGSGVGAKIVALPGAGPDQVGTAGAPIDPRLDALADNGGPLPTLMPAANSPAVDKGGASGFPAWDARGAHRPRDGGSGQLLADAGAVERGPIGYTAPDLQRALQITAGMVAATDYDGWLNVDGNAGVDLGDCARLARLAVGLQ